ncbi:MAG: murein biosynthesis integral membrane protein MurJ [Proteobacteria bacterium]|nr:murein biosynthesis integral membrane protein MurJ [Pseudomonadota bacterium]
MGTPTRTADHQRPPDLPRRAGVIALGTLTSRLLGLARDLVIAASFSVRATDTFFVAFTIPNTLRALLAEGAVANAFVPVLSEMRQREGAARARGFYASLTGVMLIILALVSAAGVLAAPLLVELYAAGFEREPEKLHATVTLTRVVFPYILFMGLAALAMAALHVSRRFAPPAFAPALLNVAMIAAPFLLVPPATALGLPSVGALALAALAGGLLQVVAQFPALRSAGFLQLPRFNFRDAAVLKTLRLLGPVALGAGTYQVNILLSRHFASYLPGGSQSFLYYGQRLVDIPQGVFALAIASASLPSLADLVNREQHQQAKEVFGHSLRLSLLVSIPASIALAVLALPAVTVFFGRGSFQAHEVAETARSLTFMALGVWAIASVRATVQMFYAYNDTRTPVVCSLLNLCVFVSASLALMEPLQHAGIAAANSLAAMVQLAALLGLLRRRIGPYPFATLARSTLRFVSAAIAMGLCAHLTIGMGQWERGGNDLRNLSVFVAAVLVGGMVYVAVAHLLGSPELGELVRALRSRRPQRS